MKNKVWKWGVLLFVVSVIALPTWVIAQTTPEQSREAVKEKVLEKGKEVREKVEGQMTPEQKEKVGELKQTGQEDAEKIKNLTPEQKAELKSKAEKAVDKLKNLTPEQKAEIKKNVTAAVEKFKGMTPEEQEALKQELEKLKDLTPEQRDKIIKAIFKMKK